MSEKLDKWSSIGGAILSFLPIAFGINLNVNALSFLPIVIQTIFYGFSILLYGIGCLIFYSVNYVRRLPRKYFCLVHSIVLAETVYFLHLASDITSPLESQLLITGFTVLFLNVIFFSFDLLV